MSKMIVQVAKVDRVRNHPNADRLEILDILGWQVVARKDQYACGDLVVYFPPDSIISKDLALSFGVDKYLAEFPAHYVIKDKSSKGRIHKIKLRGVPSYGLAVPCNNADWVIGHDCTEFYSVEKYEPPVRIVDGIALPDNLLFPSYTSIENIRNFPTLFEGGEVVSITEKIHGTSDRVAIINGERFAGSMSVNYEVPKDDIAGNFYWFPFTISPVVNLLEHLSMSYNVVVMYGEVYGRVQSLNYGMNAGFKFSAFDIYVANNCDGRYLDVDEFQTIVKQFGVPMVNELYRGPFDIDMVKEFSDGPSTVEGANNIREGCVIKPLKERFSEQLNSRLVLKMIGETYMFGDHSDYKE